MSSSTSISHLRPDHCPFTSPPSLSSSPPTPGSGLSSLDDQSTPSTSPASYFQSPAIRELSSIDDTPSHRRSRSQQSQTVRPGVQGKAHDLSSSPPGPITRRASEQALLAGIQLFQPSDPSAELRLEKRIASGQWSNVFYASNHGRLSRAGPLPRKKSRTASFIASEMSYAPKGAIDIDLMQDKSSKEVYVVKAGVGKSASEILRNEAKILTFLMQNTLATQYVVQFYGYDVQNKTLVMECAPTTLEDFVLDLNLESSARRSERVIEQLLPASRHLIEGLDFLHRVEIIHGDIKPANVLIREQNSQRDFVFCDFSASRFNRPSSTPTESAGTYDFMAPELFSLKKPDNYPTIASDVYALGVTLLHAVTGCSPYEEASNVYMRREMAKRGTPLDFVAGNPEAQTRLQKASFQPWVAKAVKGKAQHRCSAAEWKDWIENDCTS